MKLIVLAVLALLAVASASVIPSSLEDYYENLDYSKVLPVTDMPGFWDGREIRPAFYPGDQTRTGRIVGGDIVTPNIHPYQVGLLIQFAGGTGLCGGSIIASNVVLTAAHCPINSQSTQVVAGAHQLTAVEPTQHRVIVPTSGYRLHAAYNPSNLNNDIATLIVPGGLLLSAQIAVIPLAAPDSPAFAGELATVSGWGRISDGSQATSAFLRSVQNTVISNLQCQLTFGGIIIGSTICITTAGGQGTCNGDSGGPLTLPAAGGRLLIGVVSFGAAAGCELGHPAGFARVSSFHPWILANSV